MRHRNRRGKLGRKSEHRMMMLRNMATSLFERERIQTTLPRAKQLRPFAEKLITLARKQNLEARRKTLEYIHNKKVVQKLFDDIALRFADNPGGYTRIVPYRARWGDGAPTAFVELTKARIEEEPEKKKGRKAKKADTETVKGKKTKKEAKTSEKETEAAAEKPKRKTRKKSVKEEEKD